MVACANLPKDLEDLAVSVGHFMFLFFHNSLRAASQFACMGIIHTIHQSVNFVKVYSI